MDELKEKQLIPSIFVGAADNPRKVIVIKDIPFFQSSGDNSGLSLTWFPFQYYDGSLKKFITGDRAVDLLAASDRFPIDVLNEIEKIGGDYKFWNNYQGARGDKLSNLLLFGNFECLLVSMCIGGGFWDTEPGKEMYQLIEENHAQDLRRVKDYINNIKISDQPCQTIISGQYNFREASKNINAMLITLGADIQGNSESVEEIRRGKSISYMNVREEKFPFNPEFLDITNSEPENIGGSLPMANTNQLVVNNNSNLLNWIIRVLSVAVIATAGLLAGLTWGAVIGGFIGGIIGSIVPGVGTAVGATIGASIGASFGHYIGAGFGLLLGVGFVAGAESIAKKLDSKSKKEIDNLSNIHEVGGSYTDFTLNFGENQKNRRTIEVKIESNSNIENNEKVIEHPHTKVTQVKILDSVYKGKEGEDFRNHVMSESYKNQKYPREVNTTVEAYWRDLSDEAKKYWVDNFKEEKEEAERINRLLKK